jgi:hypothetical protein
MSHWAADNAARFFAEHAGDPRKEPYEPEAQARVAVTHFTATSATTPAPPVRPHPKPH